MNGWTVRNSRWPRKRWVFMTALGLACEAEALRHSKSEATLSQATRQVFRTDTTYGKLAFILAWSSLTCWWVPHVLKKGPGQ